MIWLTLLALALLSVGHGMYQKLRKLQPGRGKYDDLGSVGQRWK